MNGLVICHKGFEDVSASEIKELIQTKTKINETVVIFDTKKLNDFSALCYKGQSFIRVLYFIDSFNFKNDFFKKLDKILKNINLSFIDKDKTFKVDCERIGLHDFSSVDIEQYTGKYLLKKFKKVDLKNPDLIFYLYIYNNKCYFCVDFSFDLSKRDYKIFTDATSLKGTVAYSLVKLSKFKKSDILVDPLCGSGTIPIEAALYATNFPVNYFRKEKFAFLKLKDFDTDLEELDKKIDLKCKTRIYGFDNVLAKVKASQKNAKIAAINKKISFSKLNFDFLDTKFNKNRIDKIVTYLPSVSKRINEKQIAKLYNELFYQLDFVLKKTGTIVIAVRSSGLLKKIIEKHNFKLKQERQIWHGKEMLNVLIIIKK